MKFTHIELDRGTTPSQPMLTRHARGTLDEQRAAAAAIAADLHAVGWAVSRVKVEVDADDPVAPATDAAAANCSAGQYFEAHVKLLLPAAADQAAVADMVGRHGARLSRNARRTRPDGQHERFATQRGHRVGRDAARRAVADLLAALSAAGIVVLDVEREFVVYDSNVGVDAGWM